jgi:DNA gyrase subunit B
MEAIAVRSFASVIMSQSAPISGLEHVRRRPGMYIGGADQLALNCCVFELMANSIEEHLAGRASSITVTIHEDGSLSVKDDGGGISVAKHAQRDAPFIEVAMTEHFPGTHVEQPYRVLRLCGVGTKCVNAVSEWMQINTVRGGEEFQIVFARGPLKIN